ncbi:NADH-quinone oxidoreductase subunit B family protein [Archaeoglobus sp.]
MKVGIVKLASCSGCQVALLDTYEKFLEIADSIVYAPLVKDTRELPSCDVILVEGAVRTEHELRMLKDAREKAKILVAFGSCSALGGISGLGSMFKPEKLIADVYGRELDYKLLDFAYPIDRFVNVDYYLPGCPPTPELIAKFIDGLVSGNIEPIDYPVCAECGRIVVHTKIETIKKTELPDPKICLLSQGYVCLGSVTRGGCKAVCTKAGVPCKGCRGPTNKVMRLPCKDYLTEIHDRMKRIAGFDLEFEDLASIYAFTFSSDIMMNKPVSRIKEVMRMGRIGGGRT